MVCSISTTGKNVCAKSAAFWIDLTTFDCDDESPKKKQKNIDSEFVNMWRCKYCRCPMK